MSYHVMTSSKAGGFRPLTAAMRAKSVGSIYGSGPGAPETFSDTMEDFGEDMLEMGVDPNAVDADYGAGDESYGEEDAESNKKMMMIAGGVGAIVLIAGIAVVATRK